MQNETQFKQMALVFEGVCVWWGGGGGGGGGWGRGNYLHAHIHLMFRHVRHETKDRVLRREGTRNLEIYIVQNNRVKKVEFVCLTQR